jgi:predicted ribosome quality control (RQC) complex YloA/Tae2 family protein
MSLNWKEIDLVLAELELEGCQIQKASQPAYDLLALDAYGAGHSRRILVALSPGACRIHETFLPFPKSEKPLRFAEFLKARLVNGRIEEAVQLGGNRIVRLTVRRGENRYRLYARLWSNAANVIVTDDEGMILDAMRRLPKRGEVSGGVYRPETAMSAPAAADKYSVRELPGEGSFNKRIDAFYAEHGPALSLEKLREKAARVIGGGLNRLETALERLREKETDYQNAGRWKNYGDLIMTNIAAIEPGALWLECAAFGSEGETFRIELDRTKSPAENAQTYYEKYRKAKSGLEAVRAEIREGEAEQEHLREMEARFLAETNPVVLDRLIRKLSVSAGSFASTGSGVSERAVDAAKKRPGLSFQDGDWLFLVGRDGRENDELLRRHVRGNDLWLHARDYSGAFVFVKYRSGKTVPLEILLDAGNLALFYSGARGNGAGDCRYTQVKYLRRVKDGPPGKVIPSQEKNLSVTLDQKRLKKLETVRLR